MEPSTTTEASVTVITYADDAAVSFNNRKHFWYQRDISYGFTSIHITRGHLIWIYLHQNNILNDQIRGFISLHSG